MPVQIKVFPCLLWQLFSQTSVLELPSKGSMVRRLEVWASKLKAEDFDGHEPLNPWSGQKNISGLVDVSKLGLTHENQVTLLKHASRSVTESRKKLGGPDHLMDFLGGGHTTGRVSGGKKNPQKGKGGRQGHQDSSGHPKRDSASKGEDDRHKDGFQWCFHN